MKNFILSWALLLRLLFLQIKPPHFDESINGWFVMQIWQNGYFSYDPSNFHGPLYFYFLQFCQIIMGQGILALRLGTALVSVGCVAAVAAHRRFFGRAALWAAAIMALSPAFVFYGRYAIHESLFVLAQIIFSYGFWLYREQKSSRAWGFMLLGLVGTMTTKETFFIFFGSWLVAVVCVYSPAVWKQPWLGWRLLSKSEQKRVGVYFLLSIFAVVCLFTGFFNDPLGMNKFWQAFQFWAKTGAGHTGHEKPVYYWMKLMARYEWPGLLGLATLPLLFIYRFSKEARFWGLLGFGLLLAYSLIPYKTPWCCLNFLWPLSLALGFFTAEFKDKVLATTGLVYLKRVGSYRSWRFALLMVLLLSLSRTVRLNFHNYADPSEPYVYVQSTEDINTIMHLIEARLSEAPQDQNMRIEIATEESWPFPWLLGHYPHVRYGKFIPQDKDRIAQADIIFFDNKDRAQLEPLLQKKYFLIPLHYRDAYQLGSAFLLASKFKNILPSSTPILGPEGASL